MFCSSCGTQNAEDAKFCTKCGKVFSATSTTSTSQSNDNYGLNKPLSIWNAYKIKNPEQYGGYTTSNYRWLSVLSVLIAPVGIVLYFVNLNKSEVRKTQGKAFLFGAVLAICFGVLRLMAG